MSQTGRILKAVTVPLLYRVEFKEKPDPWGGVGFVMHPRMVPIYTALILGMPVIFLFSGIFGIIETFRKKPKIQSWTSYRIPKGEKPTKWKAYLLF